MAFDPGDEVQHKSGGPKLVVEAQLAHELDAAKAGWFVVSWFDENGKPQRETYPEALLKPYKANAPLPPFVG